MSSCNKHKVVGNLVRWVKDTTVQEALTRNQFELVMALCLEDNTYPSISPVFRQHVEDSINVSDIVDFILWGAWLEDRETTHNLLHAACALLENYKKTALHQWPEAKAGDMAHRAIIFTMNHRGMGIIGNRLKYSMAMSAISNLSMELLGPAQKITSSMFYQTSPRIFNVFATEIYMPRPLSRSKLHYQDEIIDIVENPHATVSKNVSDLHTEVWGSRQYIDPCIDTLKLITEVSKELSHVDLNHLYVAGMAISGLMASHQMLSSAVPSGSVIQGGTYMNEFLEDVRKRKRSNSKDEERHSTQQQPIQQPSNVDHEHENEAEITQQPLHTMNDKSQANFLLLNTYGQDNQERGGDSKHPSNCSTDANASNVIIDNVN